MKRQNKAMSLSTSDFIKGLNISWSSVFINIAEIILVFYLIAIRMENKLEDIDKQQEKMYETGSKPISTVIRNQEEIIRWLNHIDNDCNERKRTTNILPQETFRD